MRLFDPSSGRRCCTALAQMLVVSRDFRQPMPVIAAGSPGLGEPGLAEGEARFDRGHADPARAVPSDQTPIAPLCRARSST
jgi:hypothetical protein